MKPSQCFTASPAVTQFHLLQDAEKNFLGESGISSDALLSMTRAVYQG